jgi:trehalose utilization protein
MTINTVVWNEFVHERQEPEVKAIYPNGIHATIAAALRTDDSLRVSTATLDEPEHGLTAARLNQTDVLLLTSRMTRFRTKSWRACSAVSPRAWASSSCIRDTSRRSSGS